MNKESCGIILFKRKPFLQLLLVQRHCTYHFSQFLLNGVPKKKIKYYLDHMTNTEKNLLLFKDYVFLYKYAFFSQPNPKIFKKRLFKFKKIVQNTNFRKLVLDSKNSVLPWEFPKGRKNLKECDKDCATRELEEETSIKNIEIKKEKPLILSVIDDKEIYTSKLFLAEFKGNIEKKFIRSCEISDMNWFSAINNLTGQAKQIFNQAYNYVSMTLEQQDDNPRKTLMSSSYKEI